MNIEVEGETRRGTGKEKRGTLTEIMDLEKETEEDEEERQKNTEEEEDKEQEEDKVKEWIH